MCSFFFFLLIKKKVNIFNIQVLKIIFKKNEKKKNFLYNKYLLLFIIISIYL